MKKLLFAIVILLFPFLSNAQPVVGSVMPVKFDLGLKLAANFSSINGVEWDKSSRVGLAGGAFFSVSRNRFGGQIEALFSRARYKGSGLPFYKTLAADNNFNNAADSTTKGDFIVSYLSIPVLLNVKVAGPLWVQVGPQFNNIVGVNDKEKLVKNTDDLFKTSDLSGVLGLQLNLANLRLGARYIVGLSDVSLSSASGAWKQRGMQLSLGFTFL